MRRTGLRLFAVATWLIVAEELVWLAAAYHDAVVTVLAGIIVACTVLATALVALEANRD